MVPFSSFAQTSWTTTPTSLSRFHGYPSYELQGQGAPGVSSGDAMNTIEQLAAQIPGHQRRLGRPVLPGAAVVGAGADPLRRRADRRLPVPRRALRKLVDPGRGAAGDPARPGRRDLLRHAARAAERRLSAGRPDHDDGPVGQERDPDGRVRRARRARGQARHRRRDRSRADPAAADPDDQLRLHLRRAAAGHLDRRRAPTAGSRSAPR